MINTVIHPSKRKVASPVDLIGVSFFSSFINIYEATVRSQPLCLVMEWVADLKSSRILPNLSFHFIRRSTRKPWKIVFHTVGVLGIWVRGWCFWEKIVRAKTRSRCSTSSRRALGEVDWRKSDQHTQWPWHVGSERLKRHWRQLMKRVKSSFAI